MAGALIADPRRYGIDLVMPIFFACMLIPLWRGARRSTAWGVAGAIAGSVAGGFLDDAP